MTNYIPSYTKRIYVTTTSAPFSILILQIKNIFVITVTIKSKKTFSVLSLIKYISLKNKTY